jgi:alkylation response protein AidB-like acyl-CoA dehydrogenase/acyl carrier protein
VTAPDRSAAAVAAPDAGAELASWLRSYAAERLNSRLMDERRCIPPYVVLDFGNEGLLGMMVPRSLGGLGLTHVQGLRVIRQLAAIDLTLASFTGLHYSLGTRPILHFGTDELRASVVPELATGRMLGSFALTEPGAGSNPRMLRARAEPVGSEGWRLHGEKCWIGTASWAGVVNTFVQMTDAAGTAVGLACFAVPQRGAGLRHGPEAMTLGMRGMVQNAVYLDGVTVDRSRLLGGESDGFRVAQDAMRFGRLGLAAMSLGGIERCIQLMVRYGAAREIATGSLLADTVTRRRIGRAGWAAAALARLSDRLAAELDAGAAIPEEVYALCKSTGPELLCEIADDTVQLLGGRGYLESNGVPQLARDARLLRIFEGPTEALRHHAGALIARDAAPLLAFLRDTLAAPRSAEMLSDACETAPGPGRAELLHWRRSLLGELAGWALLAAAAEGAELAAPETWARHEFQQALQRAAFYSPRAGFLPSAHELRDLAAALCETIGDVEQTLPGESWAIDPLLRSQSSARAHADAVQGAAAAADTPPASRGHAAVPARRPARARRTEPWIRAWIAERIGLAASDVDGESSFADLGLDSTGAVELAAALETTFAVPVEPTVLWSFPTPATLAEHVEELAREADGAEPEPRDRDVDAIPPHELEEVLRRELDAALPSRRSVA